MYKKVILLLFILGLIAIFFIPVTQQKVIRVKAPFLNVYSELSQGRNWENWRPDLKQILVADSSKISIRKDSNSFAINYPNGNLNVKARGNSFTVNELCNDKAAAYDYSLLPDTNPRVTIMVVNKNISLARYLAIELQPLSFSDTRADDFKKFMETDSLFYGCNIFKVMGVSSVNLIVMRKTVLTANKFLEAAKMYNTLQQYANANSVKPVQPVIGQFIQKDKDSTRLGIGFFVDKEVKPGNGISFERMPVRSVFYAAKFKGEFFEREKVYAAIRQFMTNHVYQIPILPFETYLDNKLPTSDTSKINIRINFPSF